MTKDILISYGDLLSDLQFTGDEIKICVALSGGRDSVALLHCLKALESENSDNVPRLSICAVNIEHGIRGEKSLRDSEFVKSLCRSRNVPLYTFAVNAREYAENNGYTLEQSGRILRYKIFDELLDEGKCDFIALAHHLDDQAETVLMRIIRGTGIRGLIGMKKVSGKYIRPLLDYDRESINGYVKKHGLEFVEDETNEDTAYTRNFLRKEISEIKKRFPSICEAVGRLSESAAEVEEYLEANTPEIYVKDNVSYIKTADCVDTVIAKRLFFKAASALGVKQDIEERHYDLLLDLVSAENGKRIMLTHGLCVYKEKDSIVFTLNQNQTEEAFEYPFRQGEFDDIGVSVRQTQKSGMIFGGDVLYVDAEKIPHGTVIRTRRSGDYICKFGGGTKSLGDFLTDKKVPLRLRDKLKVVAKDDRILAVFGIDISSDVKIDENTKIIYELVVENLD